MQMITARSRRVAGTILGVLSLSFLCGGCATTIMRTKDGQRVEMPQLVQEVADAKLVLLGEKHDDSRAHRMQLDVIRGLHDRGKNLAIAAEMFPVSSQPKLDLWNEGRMDALTFQWLFEDNWSEDWSLYRDIFLYARSQHIPIIGINFDRSLVRALSTQGTAGLQPRDAAQLPPDLTCDHNAPYTRLVEEAYKGHSAATAMSFENFCLAQTAWNRGMGARIAEYLQAHPEKTVVVMAGSFHAIRAAIPAAAGVADSRIVVPAATVGAGGQADFLFK